MKKVYLILSIVLLIGLAVVTFIGCGSSGDGTVITAADPTEACMVCHSNDTAAGSLILGAKAGYEDSGHANGPRMLDPFVDTTGHIYVFHGGNAQYTNSSSCSKCHTHEGFLSYVATGSASSIAAASQPGCFTCHSPHDSGDFGLTTTAAVTLADDTVFDKGKGNLCVVCHQARRVSSYYLANSKWDDGEIGNASSHMGPHHAPQGDFLLGLNSTGTAVTYQAHATTNSCVTCHHYQEAGGRPGNFELGGHGFYLTSAVHGDVEDLLDSCGTSGCHVKPDFEDPASGDEFFKYMVKTSAAEDGDWDGDASTETILVEIEGLRNKLVDYFGDSTNFYVENPAFNDAIVATGDTGGGNPIYVAGTADAGDGPLNNLQHATQLDVNSGTNGYEWGYSWDFEGAYMTKTQTEAFWNFKLFTEDKSKGVHNAAFAAKVLWEACKKLNIAVGTNPHKLPAMLTSSLALNNTYMDITFTEQVWGAGVVALADTDFTLTFAQGTDGDATNVTISSVKQNDNVLEGSATALAGGETVVRVFLTVTGTPNGKETITVSPADGTSIFDSAVDAMAATDSMMKDLHEKETPTITTAVAADDLAADNTYIDVNFSEEVYAFPLGTGPLVVADFTLNVVLNTGYTGVTILSVKQDDETTAGAASALEGGEDVVRVFLTLTGISDGTTTIEITPATATSIYDGSDNAMAGTETTGVVTLN